MTTQSAYPVLFRDIAVKIESIKVRILVVPILSKEPQRALRNEALKLYETVTIN